MTLGTSLFLLAIGAILYFAVNADVAGIEISTVGIILMVVGVLGLLLSLVFARRGGPAEDRVVEREYRR
jgi:hypothetical protein